MLEKRDLYRLPWSMNDNPIAWLEVSDICNIQCEGCYRQRITGHKSLEQLKEEVLFFKRWRNPDNFSIAGGEPLIHPQIVELVAFMREQGVKPVILTNAVALKPDLLHELKKAGLAGFTIHIDSHQNRPHWKGKTESELNELRQQCAEMIAAEGGLYTIFNSTVYPSTYHEIQDVVRWGQANIDKVQGLVFITYRTATMDTQAAMAFEQEVDMSRLSYVRDSFSEKFVTGPEVYQAIKEVSPAYEPSSYLGGSIVHSSFKWLIGATVGTKGEMLGSVGKRGMEIAQAGHHLLYGTYLAYLSNPKLGGLVFWLAPWDKSIRQAYAARWKSILRDPRKLFQKVYLQSVGIIQAPDILPDGRADMCDSCPDITILDGKLVNSCRMDEVRLFGGFVTVVEKKPEVVNQDHG
ncbi:MAG TPA: radical SAM protein [Anaerolineaceae bacterium]|nr:radical SAM protein [Anaerolineaceae bacterium]